MIKASDFGKDFSWGIATAAPQIEGASLLYGKGATIWDTFSARSGKIKKGHKLDVACDFYHRYPEDIALVKLLGFKVFRFSIAWARVLPTGRGEVNPEGIRFYHNVIDECLTQGIVPYVTLYHWDLPQALEDEGGWTSFSINAAFNSFVTICAKEYGDKVKNWLVLNEPFGFTSLGYMLGIHAPGKSGLSNFFPAVLHTAVAQAEGGKILRAEVSKANIGTTYSCSEIIPYTQSDNDILAANRVDCLMNRLFVEPAQGLGFPTANWDVLEKFQIEYGTWRLNDRMKFDFDFIGLQNYFPLTIKYNAFIPVIQAWEVKAKSRKKPHTAMGWEINADSFYRVIKQFAAYPNIKNLMITENGAAYHDKLADGKVIDAERIEYFQLYLNAMLKVKNEGINITGYMAWTLMDNFEWAEGFNARFGLVHMDFKTLERTIKYSGYWWQEFLRN
ncbi:GH1 family beta-glucosidase [Pedobacter sp. CFBP9032]|uniref:GH1 family beta-glucosidase n=1 Tax=Pedobacter sp. CFBP9032 TaxID=3096539 RepID=UPI002A6B8FC3|nr:GH1 family beta-glucosidase [Pedobacter sp. CFBP9032]MDY0903381.1 GH1 family beta-glucosidase [Pedobacter sp. CFBP9032]